MKSTPHNGTAGPENQPVRNGSPHAATSQAIPLFDGTARSQPLITPGTILKVIRRWWKIGIPIGIVLAAISALFVCRNFVPLYRAVVWMRIESEPPFIAFQSRGSSEDFVRTQLQLIRSPMVLERVVSKPETSRLEEIKGHPDPIGWLSSRVEVNSVGNSALYHLSFMTENPDTAMQLANAVADAYFQVYSEDDAERNQRVIELLEQERQRRAAEVQLKQENIRELTKQVTGKDPLAGPLQPLGLDEPLARLQGHIVSSQVEGQMLRAELKALEEVAATEDVEVSERVIEHAIANHPLAAELAGLRAQLPITEANAREGKQSSSYQRLEREIVSLEARLEQVRKDLYGRAKKDILAEQKSNLEAMRQELEAHDYAEQVLRERYNEQLTKVKQTSGASLELDFARSELEREESVYSMLADRTFELRTELRAPGRINIMRRAEVPTVPVESLPYKMLLLALAGSMCIPFALAFVWEQLFRRIGDADEIKRQSSLPVIGEISLLPTMRWGRGANRALPMRRNESLFRESIDSLRTGLILSRPFNDMQVLAITSASTAEGKTSIASQLSLSIARFTQAPTLLIDADMRRPDVHSIFDIPLEPGLAEVLAGSCPFDDALVTAWTSQLDILPAGKLRSNPHDLVGTGAFQSLLDHAKTRYRYIIIDTPPILSASEALVFAKEADAALICTMRDVTRLVQVKAAYERLVAVGAHPIGAVLNGVPTTRYSYYYGHYRYEAEAGIDG